MESRLASLIQAEFKENYFLSSLAFQSSEHKSELLKAFAANKSIKKVECAFDIDDKDTLDAFLQFLTNNPNLEELKLRYINNEALKLVLDALSSNKELKLKTLDFGLIMPKPEIVDEITSSLVGFLKNAFTLVTLNLWSSKLKDANIVKIIDALRNNLDKRDLSELNLGKNHCGLEGCKAIAELLKDQRCRLTSLSLHENEHLSDGVSFICDAAATNVYLQKLDLSDTALGNDDNIHSISVMIAGSKSLRTLDLNATRLQDHHGALLADAIAISPSLEVVYLNDSRDPSIDKDLSQFGADTLKALGRALRLNATLNKIHLWPLNTDRNVKYFADGIAANSSLQSLDLPYAIHDDFTCIQILQAVRQNKSIKTLNLTGCEIRNAAAALLIDMIKDADGHLEKLVLFKAAIDEDNLEKIKQALKGSHMTYELYGITSIKDAYNHYSKKVTEPEKAAPSIAPASVMYSAANQSLPSNPSKVSDHGNQDNADGQSESNLKRLLNHFRH